MRYRSSPSLLAAALVLAMPLAAASPASETLEVVLGRAAESVAAYERDLVNIVAEEDYEQTQVEGVDEPFQTTAFQDGGLHPRPGVRRNRIHLKADYILIRIEGFASRLGFRDVFKVNGKAIRNREERFRALVAAPSDTPMARWVALAEESARYNLVRVVRTINVPTYALAVLRAQAQPRFRYEKVAERTLHGVRGWRIEYQETDGPTLIHDSLGQPVFARGTVVVEPATGRVLATELTTDDGKVRTWIAVTFRPDEKLATWVPVEMRERYLSTAREYIECRARYSNFRRFDVEVDTEIQPVQ